MLPTHNAAEPLVSIVIPFYKQERFIAESVASAKEQTYPSVEIIVVDDGSPVSARSVLGDSSRFVILEQENQGVSAARNLGARRCSGEYIIFLDADDRLLPGAIEAHVSAVRSQPLADLSFGALRVIDVHGVEIRPAHICRPRRNYFNMLLVCNPIGTPGSAMIRRSAFLRVGLFNESLMMAEDYELYLRLARQGPFARHTSCVLEYRDHSQGASKQQEKILQGSLTALDLLEQGGGLTGSEIRRLRQGRVRWTHECRPQRSIAYRLRGIAFRFREMFTVNVWSYLPRRLWFRV